MAAASLLVDYTLTVSVSISAGVLAITSAAPGLDKYRVEMCLGFLLLLTIGNLRGIRESGRIFAVPTYFFVVSIFALIAAGAYHYVTGTLVPLDLPLPSNAGKVPLTTFLLLTAFANGCTAMTGVEAVSNGVPAFRPPEAKNASATLVAMAVLAIGMFLGITFLAHAYRVIPTAGRIGRLPAGARRLRAQHPLLPDSGGHDADPRPRGEHRVCGLSAPGVHRVARPVPLPASS